MPTSVDQRVEYSKWSRGNIINTADSPWTTRDDLQHPAGSWLHEQHQTSHTTVWTMPEINRMGSLISTKCNWKRIVMQFQSTRSMVKSWILQICCWQNWWLGNCDPDLGLWDPHKPNFCSWSPLSRWHPQKQNYDSLQY